MTKSARGLRDRLAGNSSGSPRDALRNDPNNISHVEDCQGPNRPNQHHRMYRYDDEIVRYPYRDI